METQTSSTSNTKNQRPEDDGYDRRLALEACFVLTAIDGLLQGQGDTIQLDQDEMHGLGMLIRWVYRAVYQDGLVC